MNHYRRKQEKWALRRQAMVALYDSGLSMRQIARRYGISVTRVFQVLEKEMKHDAPDPDVPSVPNPADPG